MSEYRSGFDPDAVEIAVQELSYTVQDSDRIVNAVTVDLVSILEQKNTKATVIEATGRYVLTTACQGDELDLLIVAAKTADPTVWLKSYPPLNSSNTRIRRRMVTGSFGTISTGLMSQWSPSKSGCV
jgi:hypothetical protein